MKFKITTLDKRHRAHPEFKYRLEFSEDHSGDSIITTPESQILAFQETLEWLWDTYGRGCELYTFKTIRDAARLRDEYADYTKENLDQIPTHTTPPVWAWMADSYNEKFHLYIKDDEMLTMTKLKWA